MFFDFILFLNTLGVEHGDTHLQSHHLGTNGKMTGIQDQPPLHSSRPAWTMQNFVSNNTTTATATK